LDFILDSIPLLLKSLGFGILIGGYTGARYIRILLSQAYLQRMREKAGTLSRWNALDKRSS
jgi:hypothetical protein